MNLKKEKLKMNTNQKGITLIALVVTIVVLLILAGITITMLLDDNGIINKALQAENETEKAQDEEIEKLEGVSPEIDNILVSIGNKFIRLLGKLEVTSNVEGSIVTLTATIDGYDSIPSYTIGKIKEYVKGITTDTQKEEFVLNCFALESGGEVKKEEVEKELGATLIETYDEIYDYIQKFDPETDSGSTFTVWLYYFAQIKDKFTEEELDEAVLSYFDYISKDSGEEGFESVEDLLKELNAEDGTSYTKLKDVFGEEYLIVSAIGTLMQVGNIEFKCGIIPIETNDDGLSAQYELTKTGTYTFTGSNAFESKTVTVEYVP